MADVWKVCNAKGKGERQLASHLSSMDEPKLTLLFTLDFIPGAREIDILLLHADVGVFVIEVKAVSLDAIVSVSPAGWSIKGREGSESPLLQAYRQYEGLRDFLTPHIKRLPFIVTTACFPLIKRRQWRERYGASPYTAGIEESMIFEEDLYSGVPVFIERLKYVCENPPARQGRPYRAVPAEFYKLLRTVIEPVKPVVPTMSERKRLAVLETGITAKMETEFPPGVPRHAIFAGLPGTGKTFRLLSIGMAHAYASRRVLFCCFNKTLGSDIRRLLSFSKRLEAAAYAFDVLDIGQLATRCFDMNKLTFLASDNPDHWGELIVEELKKRQGAAVEQYDTVLVDEAQDMKTWHLNLLTMHARIVRQ